MITSQSQNKCKAKNYDISRTLCEGKDPQVVHGSFLSQNKSLVETNKHVLRFRYL